MGILGRENDPAPVFSTTNEPSPVLVSSVAACPSIKAYLEVQSWEEKKKDEFEVGMAVSYSQNIYRGSVNWQTFRFETCPN